jgi:hypothetical protein
MRNETMVYVFDIDGTVCKTENCDYGSSTPLQERINVVNALYDEGHVIFFQTARGMGRNNNIRDLAYSGFYELTKAQLDGWGVKYHDLFLGKPAADYYIDDKGVGDTDFFSNVKGMIK